MTRSDHDPAPPHPAPPAVPRARARGRERASGAWRAALAALLLAALAACGSGRTGAVRVEDEAPPEREPEGASFVVDSRLVGPVTVYVTTGVARVRLGTINVSQERRWPVPDEMIGRGRTVQLVLDQVGGPSVATERFSVEAGDVVYLTVTEQIFQSGATLRVQQGG